MRLFIVTLLATVVLSAVAAEARDFKFKGTATLKVGQSVILKGVRRSNCGDKAPSWGRIRGKLPRSKTGSYSNGGVGTVKSNSCGGEVGARGVKFTAKKAGKERLKIFGDFVRITVK